MSFFGRDKLTEKNVIRQIHNCLDMVFKGDYFAKEYVGVEVFQKRQDLKDAFIEHIQDELKRIVASDNPLQNFREIMIKTIKVRVINEVLLGEEFELTRDKICEAINRGMETVAETNSLKGAIALIRDMETFPDQPWGYTKLAHELSWAEVELLVLRHLQIMIFEDVGKKTDWLEIYHQAYTKYVTDYYRLILGTTDLSKGFPHPMLGAMGHESLRSMEETILNSEVK